MNSKLPKLAAIGIALAWLPYLALRFYWQHLIATAPGRAQGEFSGPANYFLPRLLIAAILLSLVIPAAVVLRRHRAKKR